MTPSLFKSDSADAASDDANAGTPSAPERETRPRRKGRGDSGVISVFGAGLVVEGEVRSHGDITIEGRLVGNVEAEGQVSVAGQGVVDGDITAERVIVAGRVEGTIHASEGARLVSGANVDADIKSPRLELEEGATLNGRIDMGGNKAKEGPATTSAAGAPSGQKQGVA